MYRNAKTYRNQEYTSSSFTIIVGRKTALTWKCDSGTVYLCTDNHSWAILMDDVIISYQKR